MSQTKAAQLARDLIADLRGKGIDLNNAAAIHLIFFAMAAAFGEGYDAGKKRGASDFAGRVAAIVKIMEQEIE